MVGAGHCGWSRCASAHRRWPQHPRHEQPGGVQQSRSSASSPYRGHPAAGRTTLLCDQQLGCAAACAPGGTAAGEIRLRRRARVLHACRRRCQRERGEVCAPGVRQAAWQDHHPRSFISRRELRDDGAVGGQSYAASARCGSVWCRARVAALCVSLPFRQCERWNVESAARSKSPDSSIRTTRRMSRP